jgi:hypothetical protein
MATSPNTELKFFVENTPKIKISSVRKNSGNLLDRSNHPKK